MKKLSRPVWKLGFSLIELSVVILVIGLLVIGITQGSRVITASKLKSAQALTQSSPVSSTSGLVFWLDTTRERSLENNGSSFNIADGDSVKNWYSINPQSNDSIVATQSTQSKQPVYIANGINGLPSLDFDGAAANGGNNRELTIADSDAISPPSEITIFAVIRPTDTTTPSTQAVLSKDIGGGISNPPYAMSITSNPSFNAAQGSDSTSSSSSVGASIQNNTAYIMRGYILNGQAYLVLNSNVRPAGTVKTLIFHSTGALRIGQQKNGTNRYFNGHLSEIIMFNRALKTSEADGITQYLASKYGVRL